MKPPETNTEAGVAEGRLLKRTRSRCPICHASCPAEVRRVAGAPAKVFLHRICPVHGEVSVCIASDARFYWLAKGNPENANTCCGTGSVQDIVGADVRRLISREKSQSLLTSAPTMDLNLRLSPGQTCCTAAGSVAGTLGRNAAGRGDASFEKLSTCLALIEIVNSCNLSCPTCYADSPTGVGDHLDAVPIADLQRRIQGVIDRKGGIEILQLSGGEPTLHPQFFDLVEWVQAHPAIDYLLLNTNGVRIAHDAPFAGQLAVAARRGRFQLYLQFDGPQLESQVALRGADLRKTRIRAIERCRKINLPITLAMTVTPDNLSSLWAAIEFGLGYPHVRGICFQPVFTSGRRAGSAGTPVSTGPRAVLGSQQPPTRDAAQMHSTQPSQSGALRAEDGSRSGFGVGSRPLNPAPAARRLNTADILLAAVEQAGGKLRFEDFTPLPCGDPNCATIGYLLKAGGRTYSISDFVDFTQVQGFLRDKVRYRLEDLMRCGCDSEPLGELLRQFEMDESNTFRILVKPFMDATTWDDDRIDRCCTHVIRPDGRLDSFCRYYSGFADTRAAP